MRPAALATSVLLATLLLVPAVAANPLEPVTDDAGRILGCVEDGRHDAACVLGVQPDPVQCLVNQLRDGHPCR